MSLFNVGFVIFPEMTQLDFTGPLQVLARLPQSAAHIVAKSDAPVPSDCGLTVLPTHTSQVRSAALRSAASEFGESLRDGVEVRAVGREVNELGALCRDRLRDVGSLMAAQIVAQDDVLRLQGRRQHLLDISPEARADDGAVEDARRVIPLTRRPATGVTEQGTRRQRARDSNSGPSRGGSLYSSARKSGEG